MPVKIFDPALRAGWEADAPENDTLIRQFSINQMEWTALLGASIGARIHRCDNFQAIDADHPDGLMNMVTVIAPLYPENLDDTLTELDRIYRFADDSPGGAALMFSPWPTPDLRLHDWRLGGHPPLMLHLPGRTGGPTTPPELRIEEVRSESQLRASERVLIAGFEMKGTDGMAPGTTLGPALLDDPRLRFFIGWVGDEPVSTAASFVAGGVNNIVFVATVPAAERRGYGGALTWRATTVDPTLPTVLFSSDPGRPVYERLGYIALFRMFCWWRPRGATPGG